MYDIDKIKSAASGQWLNIVNACGMDVHGQANRHQPCPICNDGVKRFRFDDKFRNGDWICNHCGSGDGLGLIDLYMGSFKSAIEFVAGYLGISEETNINQQEIDARKAESAAKAKLRAQNDAEARLTKQLHASQGAQLIMQYAKPHSGHEYLTRKRITGKTAWFMPTDFHIPTNNEQRNIKGSLLVPIINERREVVNVQVIKPDGFKMFLLDAQITGAFHLIGNVHNGDVILIGEGFATMDTLHSATRLPSVVAFNSNNLKSVCLIIDMLYPHNKKIICADNDHHNNNKKCGNAGLVKGIEAASAINSEFINPPAIECISDFNDFDCAYGRVELLNLLFKLKVVDSVATNY